MEPSGLKYMSFVSSASSSFLRVKQQVFDLEISICEKG